MKYYKVYFWIDNDFTFENVECNAIDDEQQAIFTVREYFRSKGMINRIKISHARLYFED